MFSAVVIFDDTGDIEERYEYDAYGSCSVLDAGLTPDGDGLSDIANPYLFTGRRLDTMDSGSLKLQYSRARYYDPETGRFMQRDPLGINPAGGNVNPFNVAKQYKDGTNIYEYVQSGVVSHTDPFGRFKFYGNWCGPNWSGGQEERFEDIDWGLPVLGPIDDLDLCCGMHDLGYSNCRSSYPLWETDPTDKAGYDACTKNADKSLSDCANKIHACPFSNLEKWIKKVLIELIFGFGT